MISENWLTEGKNEYTFIMQMPFKKYSDVCFSYFNVWII